MLDCLAWHLPADNLWHIWCQSAITFLIKGPQIMNIFFRWQEMLVMCRGLDLWSLSFSQSTGYLGTNQCVSEWVSEFIYLGVSPRAAPWPSVGHMQHRSGNQENGINWGGGKKEQHMWSSSLAVIQHHETYHILALYASFLITFNRCYPIMSPLIVKNDQFLIFGFVFLPFWKPGDSSWKIAFTTRAAKMIYGESRFSLLPHTWLMSPCFEGNKALNFGYKKNARKPNCSGFSARLAMLLWHGLSWTNSQKGLSHSILYGSKRERRLERGPVSECFIISNVAFPEALSKVSELRELGLEMLNPLVTTWSKATLHFLIFALKRKPLQG